MLRVLGAAGGHELHASALSSAASVLRSLPRRPEQQGVVLAGCEDGSIVGLDSVTVTALWKVDITAACSPRKSPVFNGSKSSGTWVHRYSVKHAMIIIVLAVLCGKLP